MRRSRVRDIVYKILEEDTRAREDDNYLIDAWRKFDN